jgi:hypothetical protein
VDVRWILTTTVIAAALFAGPAQAGSVFLNGVNIDGVTAQKFEKATVRIDEKGNILIDAPAYKVEVQGPPVATAPAAPAAPQVQLSTVPASGNPVSVPVVTAGGQPASATPAPAVAVLPAAPLQPPAPKVTLRYWLVTEQNAPGMTQYDIDMYINSRWVRRLRGDDDQVIAEVTKLLSPGKNTVLLRAHKTAEGPRKSYSAGQYFRVILGSGNVGGDKVLIDRPLVSFVRTAAQTDDASQEFTFITQ